MLDYKRFFPGLPPGNYMHASFQPLRPGVRLSRRDFALIGSAEHAFAVVRARGATGAEIESCGPEDFDPKSLRWLLKTATHILLAAVPMPFDDGDVKQLANSCRIAYGDPALQDWLLGHKLGGGLLVILEVMEEDVEAWANYALQWRHPAVQPAFAYDASGEVQ